MFECGPVSFTHRVLSQQLKCTHPEQPLFVYRYRCILSSVQITITDAGLRILQKNPCGNSASENLITVCAINTSLSSSCADGRFHLRRSAWNGSLIVTTPLADPGESFNAKFGVRVDTKLLIELKDRTELPPFRTTAVEAHFCW